LGAGKSTVTVNEDMIKDVLSSTSQTSPSAAPPSQANTGQPNSSEVPSPSNNTTPQATEQTETTPSEGNSTSKTIAKNIPLTQNGAPSWNDTIAMQYQLHQEGKYTGPIDGDYSKVQAVLTKDYANKALISDPSKLKNLGRMYSIGSIDGQVKKIQEFLKANGSPDITVDGEYGPGTAAAVSKFQEANGLLADGIWGPTTFTKASSGDKLNFSYR
jgi:murein L,D-transpeptidase YcbB/YkuD